MKNILILIVWFLMIVPFSDAQQKRIYLANDDHTDYMWTANEAAYDSVFVQMIDYYLQQIDSTRNSPGYLQAKFNLDGSFWVRAYEKYRSPAQFARLISAIRSGHISCPLNTLVSCYGAQPTEAVLRGMYYAGSLERKYKLRLPLAVSMENQTIPLGLASLWAGSGAKYSWRGVCGCATRFTNETLSRRRHQLYNYRGLDDQGVIMKWYARTLFNGRTLGGYAECRRQMRPTDPVTDMGEVVNDLVKMCDTITSGALYPYNAAAAFGYGWDDLATYNAPDFIHAARRFSAGTTNVSVSNETDFFEDIARSYRNLPAEHVTYGNEWDTYCASMNETTAKVRRSTEKLRSAEALATIAALHGTDITQQLTALRKQAWEAFGLYWEHDWTADGPVSQQERAAWQVRLQRQITSYADTLQQLSSATLGAQLAKGKHKRFYVFNPLSWKRTAIAELLLTEPLPDNSCIIDVQTGLEVMAQPLVRNSQAYLRLHVKDIPPLGYKVFEVLNSAAAAPVNKITMDNGYINTKYYRVRIRPSGVITEWYDKIANGRSLVKKTAGRYINDLGTKDLDNGTLEIENNGPLSITVKAVSNDPLPHTVRITLFADSPQLQIEDSIQANFADLKTWAFSFDLTNPTTRHEELGAILTAKKETNGGHYAAQNARYDWQTFNHFADISEEQYGVSISNLDCSFFRLGNSTPDSLWESAAQLNALAGGQTDPYNGLSKNKKDTVMMGIYRQNGETNFRYQFSIQPHAQPFDPVTSMKFALEEQNPLLAHPVTGASSAPGTASFSLLQIADPGTVVWGVKPSEEGLAAGMIIRLWNFKPTAENTMLTLTAPILKAWQTSHLETNKAVVTSMGKRLPVRLRAYGIQTYRVIQVIKK